MASVAGPGSSIDGLSESFDVINFENEGAGDTDGEFEFVEAGSILSNQSNGAVGNEFVGSLGLQRLTSQEDGCNLLAEIINASSLGSSIINLHNTQTTSVFQTVDPRKKQGQWRYQILTPHSLKTLTDIIEKGFVSKNCSGYGLTINQAPEQRVDTLAFGCVLVEKPADELPLNTYEMILNFSKRI